MKALKDNKEYTIAEEQKHAYLEEGYDIYGEDGKLLEYSPKKKIAYSEYAALENENQQLKKRIKEYEKEQKKAGE